MLALVAAVVLGSTGPSAAALAPRFVQVQAALPGEQPTVANPEDAYLGWTRPQLEGEWRRLDDLRPSLGLPIALLAVGAATALIDFVVFFFGGFFALLGGTGFPVQLTAAIVVAAVIAAGMLIMGSILITRAMGERRELNAQIDLIRSAIEKISTPATPDPVPVPEHLPNDPPPASPYPLQVQWAPVFVTVTLARF